MRRFLILGLGLLTASAALAGAIPLFTGPYDPNLGIQYLNSLINTLNQNMFITPSDPRYFGAKCDGVTDDSIALASWANSTASNSVRVIHGVCAFTTPLSFQAGVNYVEIFGGTLLYIGAQTNVNAITIGIKDQSSCQNVGWNIHDMTFLSSTVMTSGDAFLLGVACHFNLTNVRIGDQFGSGNTNWFNGLHEWGGNTIHSRGGFFSAHGTGIVLNGNSGGLPQLTDAYFDQALVVKSGVGIDIAGNTGGTSFNNSDIVGNGANVIVTQNQVALPNGQIFFGPGSAIDGTDPTDYPSSSGIGLEFIDPGKSNGNSEFIFTGTWLSSATNQCMVVDSGVKWEIHLTGGSIQNCHPSSASHGSIENQSLTSSIMLSGVRLRTPATTGPDVFNVSGALPIHIQASYFETLPYGVWGHIVGSWDGSYIDHLGNMSIASSLNTNLYSFTGYTTKIGPITGCQLWVQNGLIAPVSDASAACQSQLGTGAFPFTSMYFSPVLISALPACNSTDIGLVQYISDTTASGASTFHGAVANGGVTTVKSLVSCNGSVWVYD